ncbi:hypothetical protein ACJEDT_26335 (plasmid) [Rhodococcoides fascians]|uniref:hypothetical protein n=1 Tax=Rhodococcoides fascians TaxID=1828 RepID=UPI0038998E5F
MDEVDLSAVFAEWRRAVQQLAQGVRNDIRDVPEHPLFQRLAEDTQLGLGLSHARVEDFGTFLRDERTTLVRLSAREVHTGGESRAPSLQTVLHWFNLIFAPAPLTPVYYEVPLSGPAEISSLMSIFDATGTVVAAPADFAWGRVRLTKSSDFEVHRVDPLTGTLDVVYRSGADSDKRGRREDVVVHPPGTEDPHAVPFSCLADRLSLRGILGEGVRARSLIWDQSTKSARFVFERIALGQCFQAGVKIPTVEELQSGSFLVANTSVPVESELEFAEAQTSWLQEMVTTGAFMDDSVDCS